MANETDTTEVVAQESSEVEEEEQLELSEEEVEAQKRPDSKWYVIHTIVGSENKVRHNLVNRVTHGKFDDRIFQVVVPTEEEIELRDGVRRTIERRVLPGYVLVEMLMDEEAWHFVRNTPGVTGFVGSGNDPIPLREDEVNRIFKRMEAEAPKIRVNFKMGQKVRITEGPFEDFMGLVDEIDADRARVKVLVNFFGRETPVELDFLQVESA